MAEQDLLKRAKGEIRGHVEELDPLVEEPTASVRPSTPLKPARARRGLRVRPAVSAGAHHVSPRRPRGATVEAVEVVLHHYGLLDCSDGPSFRSYCRPSLVCGPQSRTTHGHPSLAGALAGAEAGRGGSARAARRRALPERSVGRADGDPPGDGHSHPHGPSDPPGLSLSVSPGIGESKGTGLQPAGRSDLRLEGSIPSPLRRAKFRAVGILRRPRPGRFLPRPGSGAQTVATTRPTLDP